MKLFETFGKNIKFKIENSPEWKARGNTGFEDMPNDFKDDDSDLPF